MDTGGYLHLLRLPVGYLHGLLEISEKIKYVGDKLSYYRCNICPQPCTITLYNNSELKHPRSCISKHKKAKAQFKRIEEE